MQLPGTDASADHPLGRQLLDVDTLGAGGIDLILAEAARIRAGAGTARGAALSGRIVVNLFYEVSTRTRVSFEIAARKLGAEVVNVSATGSSVEKGESLIDTVRTLEALGADALVVRHPHAGAPYLISRYFGGSVVNAGDGAHAHPTQALLDLLTMKERWGDLRGLRVAIVGDILHSRVARSTTIGLLLCGAEVRLCGPRALLPPAGWLDALPTGHRGGRVSQTVSLASALRDAHVIIALRMQVERQRGGLISGLSEFVGLYGLTRQRLLELAPDALLMAPGPVNEGVELAPDLVAAPNSLVTDQVRNGVRIRMAVLKLLLGKEL